MIYNTVPNVSRETLQRMQIYSDLLVKWNPRINLVAKSTIEDAQKRHFEDSAQLYALAPHPRDHWVDLGSGGGFPGLVIGIMATEGNSPKRVTLVESDARKCAFLRTVVRETGALVTVINDRIEAVPPLEANILSARALADLSTLLGFAERHLLGDGIGLFQKGSTWKKELERAQQTWKFEHEIAKSTTDEGPVILSIAGVARV